MASECRHELAIVPESTVDVMLDLAIASVWWDCIPSPDVRPDDLVRKLCERLHRDEFSPVKYDSATCDDPLEHSVSRIVRNQIQAPKALITGVEDPGHVSQFERLAGSGRVIPAVVIGNTNDFLVRSDDFLRLDALPAKWCCDSDFQNLLWLGSYENAPQAAYGRLARNDPGIET
jgi:hypothetical protein